jgi:hypothetical protein
VRCTSTEKQHVPVCLAAKADFAMFRIHSISLYTLFAHDFDRFVGAKPCWSHTGRVFVDLRIDFNQAFTRRPLDRKGVDDEQTQ